MKLHAPRLDLGEVENVVDQGKQVTAGVEHALQRFARLLRAEPRACWVIIWVRPMMELSGVRNSWLMLARNCDLCWLASASCRLLSWISSNSRTFSIAITAWLSEGLHQLDLLLGERANRLALQNA